MRYFSVFKLMVMAVAVAGFAACSEDEPKGGQDTPTPDGPENPGETAAGASQLFVVNEGGFGDSNGSLSVVDLAAGAIRNDVFRQANGFGPGDVFQSMTVDPASPYAWLVVNNSQVIFAIDPDTYKEKGRISGSLISPRRIEFISEDKAYVTQFYTNTIAVVNPKTYSITKQMEYPVAEGMTASTGEMVRVGDYVYVCCPNYNSTLLKIDTRSDAVTATLTPGIQPSYIVADADRNLWVLCNGGYQGSPYGYEAPKIVKIRTSDFEVEKEYTLNLGDYVSMLTIDAKGENLYWIARDIFTMDIAATSLPSSPLIEAGTANFYGMTVSTAGDIYVADAVDYKQPGRLLHYDARGQGVGQPLTTGVCPHNFCWR